MRQSVCEIATRAALDVGSGAIRMQVADVDLLQKKIVEVHFVQYVYIDFFRDLKMSEKNCFSQEIMDDAIAKILELKKQAAQFSPLDIRGIATEAFRISSNADVIIGRIFEETGVNI